MLKQSLQQKLQQKLSPQQIQLMKLLQVPTAELEMRIKEEIEENPALDEGKEELEEDAFGDTDDEFGDDEVSEAQQEFEYSDYLDDDVPDYKTSISNKSPDEEDKSVPLASGSSYQEVLTSQLGLRDLSQEDKVIADYLIGNIDDSGYLRRELENIVDDLAFTQNIRTEESELERLLLIIQEFDPPGSGARNLQECLRIQLERVENKTIEVRNAIVIISDFFEEFTKKHYEKIQKRMQIDSEELKVALDEILKLNPKPGNSLKDGGRIIQHIIPDFIVNEIDGELQLTLNGRNAPELKVSRTYKEMLKGYVGGKITKEQKEAALFVKQKIDSAKWFIDAIRQRQQTLLLTMNAILEFQQDYFLDGDESRLKPMILKDIADMVGLDISTISRVVNSKYAQTSHGIFLLKSFFSESISTESGEEVSNREVKKILMESIEGEVKTKPLTDEQLANLLKEKGYNIARRTVAKYREQLNIPVARLRKEL